MRGVDDVRVTRPFGPARPPAPLVGGVHPDPADGDRGPFLADVRESAYRGRLQPFGTPPAGQRVRYAVLDFAGGTVIVGTWTDNPDRREMVWEAADAVLASMEIVE